MQYEVIFTQSDAMAEHAGELPEVRRSSDEFVQITYEGLRSGPDGDDLAFLIDGVWMVVDGRDEQGKYKLAGPYSDVVITAAQ